MEQENENRTFICSVLFLDIVEYSRQSVAEQMRLKQRFNTLLGEALRHVRLRDRIVLDTGDGAAVSFLGNPGDALIVGIALRDALNADDPKELRMRLGINLGPVCAIKDLNHNVNVIGDGINVAQRVMTFAEPGQLLVSRAYYYEVVSPLPHEFQQYFTYAGIRTDKHVREHKVYVVGQVDPELVKELVKISRAARRPPWATGLRALHPALFVLLPLTMLLILALGGVVRAERHRAADADITAATAAPPAPPLNAGIIEHSSPVAAMPPTAPPKNKSKPKPHKKETPKPAKPAMPALPVKVANATLTIKVTPWGELFVDGVDRGACSPLCVLKVDAGLRRIEIHNPSASTPHEENITLQPGEQKTLNYSFH